jgi:hypothetical protein
MKVQIEILMPKQKVKVLTINTFEASPVRGQGPVRDKPNPAKELTVTKS